MQFRPISPADLPAVLELQRRSEAFDGIPRILEMAELQSLLDGAQTNMGTDTVLVEVDSNVVAYTQTFYMPSDVRLERCYVFGQVDPTHRRLGIGSKLMRWGMDRARVLLKSSGSDLPKFIRTDRYDFVEGSQELFADFDLEPVRYHDQMLRSLDDLPQARHPEGVKVVPWPTERTNEIRATKNAAFADHWGSTPTSKELWDQMLAEPTTRLDLSFVALNSGEEVVGYCLNDRFPADDELLGRKEAWIGNLGTVPEYRGRGIASALIRHSLQAFVHEGLSHACLDVDSDSLTGARRLYENLGFEAQTRTVTYELQIDGDTTT